VSRLKGFADALRYIQSDVEDAHWYLLELNPQTNELKVTGFKKNEIKEAERAYAAAELKARGIGGKDAVLVAVDSVAELPRAYPNYYADTDVFLQLMGQARSGRIRRVRPSPLAAGVQLTLLP
jgi:hypothetical protein